MPLLPPIHPGEILREEYMKPLDLSINRLALDLHVPVSRISDIVHEKRVITSNTALRLARYFGTSAEYWLNLQVKHEIEVAARQNLQEIQREVRPRLAVAG
jgi:addiction module HigA family antidote